MANTTPAAAGQPQRAPVSAFWPAPSVPVLIAYFAAFLAAMMCLFQMPGLFPAMGSTLQHQFLVSIANCLFSVFGLLVLYTLNKYNDDGRGRADQLYTPEETQAIRAAFFGWEKASDKAIVDNYRAAIAKCRAAKQAFVHIWAAWTVFYLSNLVKNYNFFTPAFLPDFRQHAYYCFDTVETLANNWVGLFAFILFLRFRSSDEVGTKVETAAKGLVIGVSLLQLGLILLPSFNPLKVNLIFKAFGSAVNGIALGLLFFRLCSRAINPGAWYPVVFMAYAISQPYIMLTITEAIILRMPPDVKYGQALQVVDDMAYALSARREVVPEKGPAENLELAWLNRHRDQLAGAFDYADLDTSAIHKYVALLPLSDTSKAVLQGAVQPGRLPLVEQDFILGFSTARRWFLLFGKAWFLVFIIWLYESHRILKYFFCISSARLIVEEAAFEDNKGMLPFIGHL